MLKIILQPKATLLPFPSFDMSRWIRARYFNTACLLTVLLLSSTSPCASLLTKNILRDRSVFYRIGTSCAAKAKGFGTPQKGSVPKTYVADDSPETTTLVQVLSSQKAVLKGTEIGLDSDDEGRSDSTEAHRGLFATRQFRKDKVICKVPSDLALALSDPAQYGDDAPTVAHGGANFLKLYQHSAKAKKQWAFYLDTLPSLDAPSDSTRSRLPVLPDSYDTESLELLEFPRLVAAAKKRRDEISSVAQESGIGEAELRQATALVSSRSFPIAVAVSPPSSTSNDDSSESTLDAGDIELDDRGQVITKAGVRKFIRVLVPYIDMVNHRSGGQPNAKWAMLDPEKDDAWFALVATKTIRPGQEITISYGSQVESSVELLLNYGFVPLKDGNPMDQYMLKKGGDDCLSHDQWTTTLEEDNTMLQMIDDDKDEEAEPLRTILQFRAQLKRSYPKD